MDFYEIDCEGFAVVKEDLLMFTIVLINCCITLEKLEIFFAHLSFGIAWISQCQMDHDSCKLLFVLIYLDT